MTIDTISNVDPWSRIKKGLTSYRNFRGGHWTFGGHQVLPVPYVDRLLRALHRDHPDHFCLMTLRWSAPVNDKFTVKAFVLPLPLKAPTKGELDSAVGKTNSSEPDWWSARLVVARYAAAAWVNLRMLLGPGRLEVEFMNGQLGNKIDADLSKKWIKAVRWVQKADNHETLRAYLLQVGCHRYLDLADQPIDGGIRNQTGVTPTYLLGIDIGGTSIKWQLFKHHVNNDSVEEWPFIKHANGSLPTDPGRKYKDGDDFCNEVYKKIASDLQKLDIKIDPKNLCVGVTWPGPVRGEPGREYVAGTSGICGKFEKLSSTITDNSPSGIHRLKIREGFVSRFECYVRLINDGDGHVNAAMSGLGKDSAPVKRLMVVVAGTGTALGLIEHSEIAPFLNEIGKMIINLVEPFLSYQPRGGNFPAGVANQLFSEKTNPQLALDYFKSSMNNQEVSWLYKLWSPGPETGVGHDTRAWEDEVKNVLSSHLPWVTKEGTHINFFREIRENQLCQHKKEMDEFLNRASWLAADLIAMCADILKADGVYMSGGPLTVIGKELQTRAQTHLQEFYGFETKSPFGLHAIRSLTFLPIKAGQTNAAEGAARAAWKTFFSPSSARGGDGPVNEIDPLLFLV